MLADELINLNDYAKEHGKSWYTMKNWLNNGLKHLGSRPYQTTLKWIDEYIETQSKQNTSFAVNSKVKIKKFPYQRESTNKISTEDYL